MDKFTYDVNVTDSVDYLFFIASYVTPTRHGEPAYTEFLPITMSIGKCISKDQRMDVALSDLVVFHKSENVTARADFRKHYIQALQGDESDWHLVRVDIGLGANLTLTYYNQKLNTEDSLELNLASKILSELSLMFKVPHKSGRPDTRYELNIKWSGRSGEGSAVIDIQKETESTKKIICYAEGDDNITVVEYSDL